MTFTPSPLAGCYVIDLAPFSDGRGWFARTYCKNEFAQIGHTQEWVQMNHSFTAQLGAIRGLHYQLPPHGEIKMVRCINGAVFDVAVDIRQGSPTFLQWFGIELSAQNKKMLYIPAGFAHGFQTLAPNSELIYHHSAFYTAGAEGGIFYKDEALNVQWPLATTDISVRDLNHPLLDATFKGI
jgi:dTDP-4-dehydrorhamnose 3,5-epimerase